MTRCLVLLIALSFAATVAQGDEWDDAMAVPGTVAAVPEHLWFPYVSTYYVKPIVTTAETLRVGYYVTDWNQSEVRADDRARRFDLTLEVWRDDDIVRTLAATNAPAVDGAFAVSPLDEGAVRGRQQGWRHPGDGVPIRTENRNEKYDKISTTI